jgi:hypothetical protein
MADSRLQTADNRQQTADSGQADLRKFVLKVGNGEGSLF